MNELEFPTTVPYNVCLALGEVQAWIDFVIISVYIYC